MWLPHGDVSTSPPDLCNHEAWIFAFEEHHGCMHPPGQMDHPRLCFGSDGISCTERCKWMRSGIVSCISHGHRSDDHGGTELDSCNRAANGSRTVAGGRRFHPFVRFGWDWWWSILQSDGGSFPGHEIQIFSIDPSTPLEARPNTNPNRRKEGRRTSIRSKPGEHHLIGSNGANRTVRAEDGRSITVGSPLRCMQGSGHSSATRCWPR